MELTRYTPTEDDGPEKASWLSLLFNDEERKVFAAAHNESLAIKLSKKGVLEELDTVLLRLGPDKANRLSASLGAMETVVGTLQRFKDNTAEAVGHVCLTYPPFDDPGQAYLRRYLMGRTAGEMAGELRQKLGQTAVIDLDRQAEQWQEFLDSQTGSAQQ